jgi:site-specific DNA-methyltransferase (adenine-specific)
MNDDMQDLFLDYETFKFRKSRIIHANCFEWLARTHKNSLHSIVTDPPYGVKEYDAHQLEKRSNGIGGMWRIPPSFDGHVRAPLPRFTALDEKDRKRLSVFFTSWSVLVTKALRPGGHVFIATNAFIAALLYEALVKGGLEFRGQIIRVVRTLRGGDRPKNAEKEFQGVSTLPKGCYEPWGLFRKPIPKGMTVGECLRKYETGGIRRLPNGKPFEDLIHSERTPRKERDIADHPSLKPQSFMRQLVYASLPLGKGIIADPFMGAGSTIAAAEAMELCAIGIERYRDYFDMARDAIPRLKAIGTKKTALLVPERSNANLFMDNELFESI